jgi:hypothetical protein
MRTKSTYWGQRADKAHLTTETLQILTKVNPGTVLRTLVNHQEDGGVIALVVIAWEIMDSEQRRAWVAQAQDSAPKPGNSFLALLLEMPDERYGSLPAILYMAWNLMTQAQQKDWVTQVANRKAVTQPRAFKKGPVGVPQ